MIYGPQHGKSCLQQFANNKGSDQPAQTDQTDQSLCYWLIGK